LSYHPAASDALPRLGRYELIGQLATGGMAEIHLARLAGEAGFEKIVVVKRLLPELVASKAFVAMFLEEAKLVARLDHPNICEVFELGRDGAEYFIVMPYLDGLPASDLIARPRDPDRIAQLRIAAGIVAQACAGLHHAHELRDAAGASLGLVHRDVSPSNLFVTTAGTVKVLDFGVAKIRGASETEAGTIKGKTQYMAPEQLLGQELDRRCDVFALGIVLFELATHQRLFARASDYLAARAILEEPIPRAETADPAVPPALGDVIARALERDRTARFADARELARALDSALAPHGGIADGEQIAAALRDAHGIELTAQRTRQLRVLDDARSRATASSHVATQPHRSRVRRNRITVLALAATVALAGGVLAWRLAVRNSDVREPAVRDADTGQNVRVPDVSMPDAGQPDVRMPDAGQPDVRMPDAGQPDVGHRTAGQPDVGHRTTGQPDVGHRTTGQPDVGHRTPDPGSFSVDSNPFATIYIDDHMVGITPLIHRPLAAGHHKLRAVLRDGRSRELELDVPAGKAAQGLHLTW
jgi:serine/threonine-protein kinase